MTESFNILIVGAGHAGAQAAIALRQRDFKGTIALLGEEEELPYERPPLSKDYLAGDKPFDRLLLRPATFWMERQITLIPGERIVAVDPAAHTASCASGRTVRYETLIWATGGHARRLSCAGGTLAGVHSVRSRADVDRMIAELPGTRRVGVVGGGYVGLEAAAVLSKLGRRVTVFETQDRVLARVAGEALSRFYEAEHRAHGVDVRLGVTVDRIEGRQGRVIGIRLADGEVSPCEMVIVGIGIVPAVEPLLEAGAAGGNGVEVDAYGQTSLPDVYAIGDCALHSNRFAGDLSIRLESVQNANDMAAVVAAAITGRAEPYNAVPWFWSNQFDLKLQTVGLSAGFDQAILRGNPQARSFSVVYLRRGAVIALDCVNAVKDYVQGKALVLAGSTSDPAALADTSIPLKSLH